MRWFVVILLCIQITEILVHSDHLICKAYRWIMSWPSRIYLYDIECGWCTSVWVGGIFGYLFRLSVGADWLGRAEWILCGIAISRLANFAHNIFNRHYKGLPLQLVLFKQDMNEKNDNE